MRQRHLRIWLLTILSIFYLNSVRAALPEIQLQIGMRLVRAEVANTSESRMKGLMDRKQLDDNQGMLFVYERPEIQAMWMRKTPLPLAVAFMDERGVILNISEMVPFDDTPHSSVGMAKYALEMNGGWFSHHGVKAGDKVKGLPR